MKKITHEEIVDLLAWHENEAARGAPEQYRCAREAAVLREAIRRLEEYEELEQTSALVFKAIDRGSKLWQQRTRNKLTWPDTARLVGWLVDEAEKRALPVDLNRAARRRGRKAK